jgi:hypothetical protein
MPFATPVDPEVLVLPTLPVVRQLSKVADARPWLADLPRLITEVRDEFGLQLAAPIAGGSCSWVAPARTAAGTDVIVKISWPHREMLAEPAALRHWDGRGAVRLLAHDPDRHALLLERCLPGRPLTDVPGTAVERTRVGCAVLRQLWQAPLPPAEPGFEDLANGNRRVGRPGRRTDGATPSRVRPGSGRRWCTATARVAPHCFAPCAPAQ